MGTRPEHEYVYTWQLATAAPRQLLVVDACRAYAERIFEGRTRVGAGMGALPDEYRATCREAFDVAVLSAEAGRSTMYACSPGEAAGDTAQGGTFSRHLLEVARAWAIQTRQPYRAAAHYLDVPNAFAPVRNLLVQRYGQHPVLENGRRMRSFPFTVA